MFVQALLECHRAERGSGHALAIDRIESTNRITEQQEVIRQLFRTFVATKTILRGAMRLDRRDRFSAPDRIVDR